MAAATNMAVNRSSEPPSRKALKGMTWSKKRAVKLMKWLLKEGATGRMGWPGKEGSLVEATTYVNFSSHLKHI